LGRVWITDRGMASADNLTWLRQTGRPDFIGAPKSEPKKFALELARPDGWRMVNEGVEVKLTRHAEPDEMVILCRSADQPITPGDTSRSFAGRVLPGRHSGLQ
jgi:hypothetical protein